MEHRAEPTDAEVMAAALDNPAAFGTIFDRHATVVRRYLVRRLGPDEADGMVGDVFRIAFERRATFDVSRDSARPWLYGIATNRVAKHRRSEARRFRAVARLAARRDAEADVGDAVSSSVDAAARWPRIAAAVAALPEAERDALVLHVWEGLPYAEVALALDVPVGTVRSRLNRARTRLRELDVPSGEQPGNHLERPGPERIES